MFFAAFGRIVVFEFLADLFFAALFVVGILMLFLLAHAIYTDPSR